MKQRERFSGEIAGRETVKRERPDKRATVGNARSPIGATGAWLFLPDAFYLDIGLGSARRGA